MAVKMLPERKAAIGRKPRLLITAFRRKPAPARKDILIWIVRAIKVKIMAVSVVRTVAMVLRYPLNMLVKSVLVSETLEMRIGKSNVAVIMVVMIIGIVNRRAGQNGPMPSLSIQLY